VTVLFTSKTWGGDFYKFLQGAFDKKWLSCDYPFSAKWLLLNNKIPKLAYDEFRVEQIIDVEKYTDIVLKFFKLKKEDFKGGYYYSICELTEIYLADRFDYLVHFASDVTMSKDGNWVEKGIKILKENPHISVVSPASTENTYHDENGLDQMFSDHCYLIKVSEFRKPIYLDKEPVLDNYPKYAGNTFEKMVGRYLHNNKKYRRILDEFKTEHPSW